MNGPQHYRQAERLARQAEGLPDVDAALTAAQLATAHATLALAAATALTAPVCTDTEDGSGHETKADWDAWKQAAGGGA